MSELYVKMSRLVLRAQPSFQRQLPGLQDYKVWFSQRLVALAGTVY